VLLEKMRVSVLALAIGASACVAKSSSLARDTSGAEDVNATESDIEALGSSFIGQSGQSIATAAFEGGGDIRLLAGTTTVGNPGFWFQPAGCLQVTVDASSQQATYVFSRCTGPLGLARLDGTVTVSWQVTSSTLTLTYAAQGFRIDGATITSWTASAVVTAAGDARNMQWSAELSGTTAGGRQFVRQNQKDLEWMVGQPCLSVSGQSDGTISGAHLVTTITRYERCADACPAAGSEILVQNADTGGSIDIVYQGGPEAVLTVNGKSTTIGLSCGG